MSPFSLRSLRSPCGETPRQQQQHHRQQRQHLHQQRPELHARGSEQQQNGSQQEKFEGHSIGPN